MSKKQSAGNAKKKVLIGAGIVAGAALAAYLLTSPKTRKKAEVKIKKWMKDMQKEVAVRTKAMQNLSQEKYNEIVDEILPKYGKLKDVSGAEIDSFSKELKAHWNNISKVVSKSGKAKKKK